MKKLFIYVSLVLILCIGALLRFSDLSSVPAGVTLDEVAIGYDAFSFLTTGKDHTGRVIGLSHVYSLGDYKLPLAIYFDVPFQKFLGQTILAIRLPAVLFGLGVILITFFLGEELAGQTIGLIASFLLAISPWHIAQSRLGLETNPGLFFFVTGILFSLKMRKKIWYVAPMAFFFLAAIYTHHEFWIAIPLMGIIVLLSFWNTWKEKKLLIPLVLSFLCIGLLSLPILLDKNGANATRIGQSLFSPMRLAGYEKTAGMTCHGSALCSTWSVVNAYSTQIVDQYTGAFSFIIWFLPSDFDNVDVASTHGLFYLIDSVFLVAGIVALKKERKENRWFIALWILCFPLTLVLTSSISAARMYWLLPAPQLVEAYGLMLLWRKNWFVRLAISLGVIVSVINFTVAYYSLYPRLASQATGYPATEIAQYASEHQSLTPIFIHQWLISTPFYVYYFASIPPNKIDTTLPAHVVYGYKNVYVLNNNFLPATGSAHLFIGGYKGFPPYYTVIDELPLIGGGQYAPVGKWKE